VAHIKSALELAMERTENIKGSKESIEAQKYREKGMKLGSELLENPTFDLGKQLKQFGKKERPWVIEGLKKVLFVNLSLPASEEDIPKLATLRKGFETLTGEKKKVTFLFQNVEEYFKQYLGNKQQLIENLRNQFSEKMQQKKAALSQKLGMEVNLDPSSDPEFAKALQQNMNRLKDHYGQVVTQAKEELEKMLK
jgi:hypothetical protein